MAKTATTAPALLSKDEALLAIAISHLNLDTLDTRRSDSLDFSDQAVWALKAALEAAYEAGKRAR